MIAALQGFVFGEACLQLLNAATGLLLVRCMTVEQFAQYALANAFQLTAQQFVEFGLGGSLVALVGQQVSDRQRMGRLIAAGTNIRRRMLTIVGAVSAVVFPFWFIQKGWPLGSGLVLTVAVLGYLVFSGLVTYYTPPLAIRQQTSTIYRFKLASALIRLAAFVLAYMVNVLIAPLAALLNVGAVWFSGAQLKKASAPYLEVPSGSVRAEEREILAYIRPIMPGVVFAAIQGQLAIFIAAWFGQTATIAEVGALSRLGLVFGFFSAANGMLIAPFIARQSNRTLYPRYMVIAAGASGIAVALYLAAWSFPRLFLSILGPEYSGSKEALLLMVVNAALSYVNSVLWAMSAARKWVFWWMPVMSISGTLAFQAAGLWIFDVSTAVGVFQMMLLGSAYVLLTRLVVAVYGFTRV